MSEVRQDHHATRAARKSATEATEGVRKEAAPELEIVVYLIRRLEATEIGFLMEDVLKRQQEPGPVSKIGLG